MASDPWASLQEFTGEVDSTDQVLLIAGTGGAKSTLAATMTLPVHSMVAVDEKGALTLPGARVHELAAWDKEDPSAFETSLRYALAWQDEKRGTNRVIVRPHVHDIDNFAVHDAIFEGVYAREHTVLWLDEISATGATAQRVQNGLKACVARGRTRGIGVWTCSQSAFGLVPPLIRRNATYSIFGSMDARDTQMIPYEGIEIAATIPRKSGRFIVYRAGEQEPYRLYLPIPPVLRNWRAP